MDNIFQENRESQIQRERQNVEMAYSLSQSFQAFTNNQPVFFVEHVFTNAQNLLFIGEGKTFALEIVLYQSTIDVGSGIEPRRDRSICASAFRE